MSYRYDLHLHSDASADCRTPLAALVRMARRRGLAGLAVTDHDTMDGVRALARIWPHDEIQLIEGCERTLSDGSHLIGLFLHQPLQGKSPQEVIGEIRQQGGLVYLPHPFRAYSGLLGPRSKFSAEEQAWVVENCDILEVYNSKCLVAENRQALKLLEQYPKAFAASSDAHYAYEIGTACTEYAVPLSPAAFVCRAVYAPPAPDAEKLAMLRDSVESPARKGTRKTLKQLGLFGTAKSLRNTIRCYLSPKLERYR